MFGPKLFYLTYIHILFMLIFVSIFFNLRIRDRCFVPVTAFVFCRHADQMPDEIREAHRREALV